MRSPVSRALRLACPVVLAATLAAACSSDETASSGSSGAAGAGGGPVAVKAGDKKCEVASVELAAGRHTFAVTNTASQVTEVYVYAAGDRIMGEVENVGPSTKRNLIVDLPAGEYQVACKPGMVGDGIRTALKVTGKAAPPQTLDQNLQTAVTSYQTYVESETQALVDTTATFVAAISSGDLAKTKEAYPAVRLHYERIEPIAESFGDLDPLIDMRIDDATPETPFVGFHAIEQKLFEQKTLDGTQPLATALTTNVGKLNELVKTVELTPLVMANGAKSLLDEVAASKVTGEEERYSRIDLVDFAGNVDGAKYVYSALRPALQEKDPELVSTLDKRFPALVSLLDTHLAKPGDNGYIPGSPYVSYDTLTPEQVKALAVEVDAISEPIGQIAGVVTSK
ncbi:iron uptake system component EfeO [Parafrankia irregularis]|uniref:Iron uptake system component EfeO n=1 Tax=Parafrankia irregularis TaxID=795642 RepID=A0A0S4QKZ6_9ACTN|nr:MULTISPECIES: iron uptake system protein EfeO [Parafrankia]MBE3205617.1 peptidase M75 family protein [Parafrankia sp. CH37]CUU55484.1 iron uptake system component EfeO [Parafrankia irregularis]